MRSHKTNKGYRISLSLSLSLSLFPERKKPSFSSTLGPQFYARPDQDVEPEHGRGI